MYLLLLLLVLAACGRPEDDCWRGPVPIVRECPCECGSARGGPPSVAYGDTSPNAGDLPPLLGEVPGGERSELEGDGGTAPCRGLSLEISQLMIDPTDLPDRDGEWLEVHNPTPLPADAKGVEIAVNGVSRCVLSDVTIPAFGYVLIARKGSPNHLPCPRLSLAELRGEVALVRCGEVLDVLVWEKAPKGARLSATPLRQRSSPQPPG